MRSSLLRSGELVVKGTDLLSAVWYSDGSGATDLRSGLDSCPDQWDITGIALRAGYVFISIRHRNEDEEVLQAEVVRP